MASVRGSAVKAVASFLDKSPRTALNIATAVGNDIVLSQEFQETYNKMFRKWYDQRQDIARACIMMACWADYIL